MLFTGDVDTNSRLLVMEVQREKHPEMCIPDITDLVCSSLLEYNQDLNVMPIEISE